MKMKLVTLEEYHLDDVAMPRAIIHLLGLARIYGELKVVVLDGQITILRKREEK